MKKLTVHKSRINGSGLFAKENVRKGEVIGYIHGKIHVFKQFTPEISRKMLNWIGAGRYSWIETTDSPFRFINHSCEPNVVIITKRKVIALKDIKANDEIVMDYSLTEAEPNWSISCTCESQNCRKKIGPIQTVPVSRFKKLQTYIPKPFQKIYEVDVIHKKTRKGAH